MSDKSLTFPSTEAYNTSYIMQRHEKRPGRHHRPPKEMIIRPYCKVYTLLRDTKLNQPKITPVSNPTTELITCGSPYRTSSGFSSITFSTYLTGSTTTDYSLSQLTDMFTVSLRKMHNRNSFVQKVFFVLGTQMCFAFVLFFLLVYKNKAHTHFSENMATIVGTFSTLITLLIFFLSLFYNFVLKHKSFHCFLLVFATACVTLIYASLAAYFSFLEILIYITSNLMFVFFISAVLSLQNKCEAGGGYMFLIMLIITFLVSVGISSLLFMTIIPSPTWVYLVVAAVITMCDLMIVVFVLRHITREKDVRVQDYKFGALNVYLSITTFYVFRSFLLICKKEDYMDPPMIV